MNPTVSKTILVGYLVEKPLLKHGKGTGNPYLNFSLKTDETGKDGTKYPTYHNVKLFGKRAENFFNFSNAGDLIYVDGQYRKDSYTDKHGLKKTSWYVVPSKVENLVQKKKEFVKESLQRPSQYIEEPNEEEEGYDNGWV